MLKKDLIQAEIPITEKKSFIFLSINAEETHILFEQNPSEPEHQIILKIGYQKTAREFFWHHPPTPLEIETAINMVEDEIIPLHTKVDSSSILVTTDSTIEQIALLAGIAKRSVMMMSLDAMEQVFNRFADIVSGRPVSQDTLPDSLEFAATLLILREWMHHLRFEYIIILRQ